MSVQVENLEKNMAKLTIWRKHLSQLTRSRRSRSVFRDSVKEKFREP